MSRPDALKRAEARAELGGEPVLEADFIDPIKIKLFKAEGGPGVNEHTYLNTSEGKYKGHVEMVLFDKGIRVRSIDRPDQVRTVAFANIKTYISLSDLTWSQDRYDAEQAAKETQPAA
jgi:hypothetical protein